MSAAAPKLRTIEPRFHVHEGQEYFALLDPHQLRPNSLLLPRQLGPLLMLCDGTRTLEQIQEIFSSHYQIDVEIDLIEHFVDSFDKMRLLDNEQAQHALTEKVTVYRSLPYRVPALAGAVYSADPGELQLYLNDQLESSAFEPASGTGQGLLSPHIDFGRGERVYLGVWKRASKMVRAADLIVIFGTDHHGASNPITLTRQNYATPQGLLCTDQEVVSALEAALGADLVFKGELNHVSEHSIELIAVWLKHILGDLEIPIVPILTGAFENELMGESSITENALIACLEEVLNTATAGRRVFYAISGDLAHVGPAFDGDPLDRAAKANLREQDDELLSAAINLDPEQFFSVICRSQDKNNVCGPYIYTWLCA